MNLKTFLNDVLHIGGPVAPVQRRSSVKASSRVGFRRRNVMVIDLENLTPSASLSRRDIEERVRQGRFAEMSLHHAGVK